MAEWKQREGRIRDYARMAGFKASQRFEACFEASKYQQSSAPAKSVQTRSAAVVDLDSLIRNSSSHSLREDLANMLVDALDAIKAGPH